MTFLKAEKLSIHFGGVMAVQDVTFEVKKGEVYAIVGPNGAGKTTVFNMLSRLYEPSAGRVVFEGHDITSVSADKIAQLGIARTFQNIELFEHATVLHNLMIGRYIHRTSNMMSQLLFLPSVRKEEIEHRRKVEEVIDFLDLQHYRYQKIDGLPYGIRKVVELGRALCTEPKLLLLDEPTSGLNVEESEDMSFWIEDIKNLLGITVIMIEHNMGVVTQVSDRVLALNEGKVLAEGTPDVILRSSEVIEAYLGEQ